MTEEENPSRHVRQMPTMLISRDSQIQRDAEDEAAAEDSEGSDTDSEEHHPRHRNPMGGGLAVPGGSKDTGFGGSSISIDSVVEEEGTSPDSENGTSCE